MARLAPQLSSLGGVLLAIALSAAPRNLEIYWIDAEGGATLICGPGDQCCWWIRQPHPDDRDASRILAAARLAAAGSTCC